MIAAYGFNCFSRMQETFQNPDPEYVEAVPIEPSDNQLQADLERVRVLAELMDSKFEVMGIRFGLDSIVGLIPVVGDTLALLPTVYPMMIAKRYKLGRALVFRMGVNVAIDWLIGLIPVLGDVFDIAIKANLKNAKLLHNAVQKRDKRAAGKR